MNRSSRCFWPRANLPASPTSSKHPQLRMNNVPIDNTSVSPATNGVPTSAIRTKDQLTSVVVGSQVDTRGRSPGVSSPHKQVLTPPTFILSDNPQYITSGGAELQLYRSQSLWRVQFYRGGELPASLAGAFLTKSDAHRAVVLYLKSHNVRGTAKWPETVAQGE